MKLYHLSLNNLRRRKAKFVFLVLGLLIGIATIVSLFTITRAMSRDVGRKLDEYGANILIAPRSEELALSYGGIALPGVSMNQAELTAADLERIRSIPNAENISIIAPKLFGKITVKNRPALLVGVDFAEERRLKKWWKVHGEIPKTLTEALVGAALSERLGLSVGEGAVVGNKFLKVSGILEETGSSDDNVIFADRKTAEEILGRRGKLSLIEVAAFCNTCPIEEMVRQISAALPGARVTAVKQAVKTRMDTVAQLENFSRGISGVVLAIGGLTVFITMMASVNERTREIGVFRAIGFREKHIMQVILLEALVVSITAGILGYFVGTGIAAGVLPRLMEKGGGIELNLGLAGLALFLSAGFGLGASLYPAWHAARMDPTTALRSI